MSNQLFITDNLFDRCLKAFLFLLPIIWLPGFTQVNLQLLFFNYGALILFGMSVLTTKREFSNPLIFLFLITSITISVFRNPYSFSLSLLNIVCGCLLYYAIVRSAKDINGILKIFVWVGAINMVMAALQIFGLNFLYQFNPSIGKYPVCGFMGHKNHLAMFLTLISPILLHFSWVFLIPVLILLLYLDCLSALLGFFVGLAILVYFKKRIFFYRVTALVAMLFSIKLLLSFHIQSYRVSCRLPVWIVMLKESFLNPFLGFGLDSFKVFSKNLSTDSINIVTSYSEYMLSFFEWGILPVIVILYYSFKHYKKIFIKENPVCQALLASVLSFLIMMGFQDPLHITRLAIPFLVVLACLEVVCIENRKEILC